MDIKTVFGMLMIGAGFLFQAIAHQYNIDGTIAVTLDSLIAGGLFLISGKELFNKAKGVS